MKKFIFVIFCLYSFIGTSDTLLWQITDTTLQYGIWRPDNDAVGWYDGSSRVDNNSTVYTFINENHANDDVGIRVAVYDGNGNLISYLAGKEEPEYADIWLSNDVSTWRGLESYTPNKPLNEMELEMRFQLQIGYYDEDFNFISELYSNTETADNLYESHIYERSQLGPSLTDQIPSDFYTINPVIPDSPPTPEPNTTLLFTIGSGLLLLRRKLS